MLYKYCKIDAFDILLKARLLTSRLEKINDPFELVFGAGRSGRTFLVKPDVYKLEYSK
jgi:hypothetical protein